MGATLVLFLLSLYAAHRRNLLRPAPLVVTGIAAGLGFALRVLTYMPFLRIVNVHDLEPGALFFTITMFGMALLIGYIFVLLAILNLFYPRCLKAADLLALSCLSGFGISLLSTLYGIGKVAVAELGRLLGM
jgi:RsiW-degrading membrane proteinase PrsW (M82 family)